MLETEIRKMDNLLCPTVKDRRNLELIAEAEHDIDLLVKMKCINKIQKLMLIHEIAEQALTKDTEIRVYLELSRF